MPYRARGVLEKPWSPFTSKNALSVLPNLFDALKKLRANRYPPIWIDRICISQKDHGERTSQVMLMRDIYRTAKLVLVDLGGYLGPGGVKTIVNLVGDFKTAYFASSEDFKYDFYVTNFHPETLCKYGLPARTDPSWDVLRLFLEQPWFLAFGFTKSRSCNRLCGLLRLG
jgi:hypothetical protein